MAGIGMPFGGFGGPMGGASAGGGGGGGRSGGGSSSGTRAARSDPAAPAAPADFGGEGIPFYEDEPVTIRCRDGTLAKIKTIRYVEDVVTLYHTTNVAGAAGIAGDRGLASRTSDERTSMGNGVYFARDTTDTAGKARAGGPQIHLRAQVRLGRVGVATAPLLSTYGNISGEECLKAGITAMYGGADPTNYGVRTGDFPFSRDEWVVFDSSKERIPLTVIENAKEHLRYEDLPDWVKPLYDKGEVQVDNGLYRTSAKPIERECRHGFTGLCVMCDLERGMPGFGGDGGGGGPLKKGPEEVFVRGYSGRDKEAAPPAKAPAGWSPVCD